MIETYLKSIAVAGYRSYGKNLEQNRIDLKEINMIIGANGAGKSNLISFLEMVSFMMPNPYFISEQKRPSVSRVNCEFTMITEKKRTFIPSAWNAV